MARVLVLGGYGLVGSNVARLLAGRGHEVVALGRDRAAARRVLPGYTWVFRDLRDLTRPEDWAPLLSGIDAVVNCTGALQASLGDAREVVLLRSIGALVLACEKAGAAIVQISAAGAEPTAGLAFLRTKAEGDALIREARVPWWIFRPGFVIAPSSYGASTLIRVLAAVPLLQPMAFPEARVQTVAVSDVGAAVARAIEGVLAPGLVADLVEDEAHSVRDLLLATRRWLGFPAPRATLVLPRAGLALVGVVSDLLGLGGWRSSLRREGLRAMARGEAGNPAETRAALGRPAQSLAQSYHAMPARVEDRMFARIQLLAPLFLMVLALTWVWKGMSGLWGLEPIVGMLELRGIAPFTGRVVVAVISTVTIVLGLSVLIRRLAVRTLVVMVFVTLFYGAAITIMAPALWLDPFGAGANVLVVIVALLGARVMLDTR